MKTRKEYSAEYKQDAIALAEKVGPNKAARDLGIDRSILYQWRRRQEEAKKDGLKAFPGQGNPRDEELHALRKRVADLEEANEILKKAAVIFAKESTR